MKWNGTVSQVGPTHIAPRFATANPAQATSSHGTRCSGHSQRLAASSAIIDPVPLATNRSDHFRAELGPQPGDVDVDHVGAGVEVVPPDRGEQPLLRNGLAGVSHQLAQQKELALGE